MDGGRIVCLSTTKTSVLYKEESIRREMGVAGLVKAYTPTVVCIDSHFTVRQAWNLRKYTFLSL
jgi:hypothetical protein